MKFASAQGRASIDKSQLNNNKQFFLLLGDSLLGNVITKILLFFQIVLNNL